MNVIVIGGAGFIGSCCAARLLDDPACQVTIFDNFSSGRRWHLEPLSATGRIRVITGDAQDLPALVAAMRGQDLLYHFASNPDIAKAATEPTIDFFQGTLLSQNIFEAARVAGVKRVIYASGSGIFGDDATKAFSLAAPGIRETFGSAENFMAMVRNSYAVVYRPANVAFELPVLLDGQVVQPVRMTDAQGRAWIALYPMQRQPDGSWRTNGCQLARVPGQQI